jgi:hypothetical protein
MRTLLIAIAVLGLSTFISAGAPPSEASIREMLRVTDAKKVVETMIPQVNQMMLASMKQALGTNTITAAEQQSIEKMQQRMISVLKEELSWEVLEPMYISIYQKSFTQEELDGILEFYKTPAGMAMIKKMPVVMQNSMAAMQERMGPIMKKVQVAVKETVNEIQKSKSESGNK